MATRRGMLRLLEQHRRNLEALELQKAQAGPLGPVAVDLQIEDEREAIQQLEADLNALDANSIRYLNKGDGAGADAEAQAIMDAQLSRIETKLETINERTYDTRNRMAALERDMADMSQRMAELKGEVTAMQHGPQNVNRTWLLSGAVLLAAMFILVVLLALRLV